MAPRRSRSSDLTVRPAAGAGRRRGSVSVTRPLPRFVRIKTLASGTVAFYWDLTGHYRRLGCSIPGEPLGTDYVTACGEDGNGGRAAVLKSLFDEWRRSRSDALVGGLLGVGEVNWLFREYKQTKAISRKSRSVRVVITSGRCCWSRTWSPRRGTVSATER